jgi:CheY-like chemotaxis protein
MKSILVVDDDPDIRSIFQILLENTEHNFVLVEDGVDAFSKIQKNNFDLVITDIAMPKMGGMELIRKVRDANHTIMIKAISACPIECIEGLDADSLLKLNFTMHSKPLKFDEIVGIIES